MNTMDYLIKGLYNQLRWWKLPGRKSPVFLIFNNFTLHKATLFNVIHTLASKELLRLK